MSDKSPNNALHLAAKSGAPIVAMLLAASELGRYVLKEKLWKVR